MDVITARQHLFLGSRLKRLGEQLQAEATVINQEAGIPVQPGQYPILVALMERGPMTVGELSEALEISQPAITKQASRLAGAGLVDLGTATDRRVTMVSLTEAGEQVLAQSRRIWPAVEAAVREATGDLGGSFLEQLAGLERRLKERPLSERARALQASSLAPADPADLPAVVSLMNRAYRGDAGWTTEAAYIDGERTSQASLRADLLAKPDAVLLVRRMSGAIVGCVWVEPLGEDSYYLGSLTVEPGAQNGGLGRRLLAEAEAWIEAAGGREIRLTVVNVRGELIAWYLRRGYQASGETEPFPYGDERFGRPKRDDLAFVVLRKRLGKGE